MLASSKDERLARMRVSLEGLSIGDAFGERFFLDPDTAQELIADRSVPSYDWREGDKAATHSVWEYTDDTMMALSVVGSLSRYGEINQDWLAQDFADRYHPSRGYGPSMNGQLRAVRSGSPWREVAGSQFGGQGSFGNGAAMRVAPLGAYFADDMDTVIEQARLSAEVTHTHREGVAGAIAVAVAAAWAWRLRDAASLPSQKEFLNMILPLIPDSEVHEKVRHARNLAEGASVHLAVSALGNGLGVSAQDTVPFCLWCASQSLNDYESALWLTVSGLGDRDTTCAIVGGIVASYTDVEGIPDTWLQAREPLPNWPFEVSQ